MARVILHADCNSFYASCELCYRPELRGKPVVVGGDQEARHGIVLAKSDEAKRMGVKTGQALWQARDVCPRLIILKPDYGLYLRFSAQVRRILYDYTDQVEPFGLDECWLDISGPGVDMSHGVAIADHIRRRIRDELGITASVGVGDNKIMAKLGSDYKKPDATTLMSPEDYQTKAWPLPVGDLLYVGPATRRKLNAIGVYTIGGLASLSPDVLTGLLGKVGHMLSIFARGLDTTPVSVSGYESVIKSIGNSTTTPRDLITQDDVRLTLFLLSESVASRLRDHGFRARTIEISVRDNKLSSFGRQRKIPVSTCVSREIAQAAQLLFAGNYDLEHQPPLRSIGVRGADLVADTAPEQVSLFDLYGEDRARAERLDRAIDGIRARYGPYSVRRGLMLQDTQLSGLSPKDDHTIHPVSYFA